MQVDKSLTKMDILKQSRPVPGVTAIVAPPKSQEAIVAMTNNMFYLINHHHMVVIKSFRSNFLEPI